MKITYKTKKLEKICTDASQAEKKHGKQMAAKIHQRIDEISAADTVEMMIQFHIGRCHVLTGEYSVTSEPLNPLHRATHSECRSHPYEKVNPLLRATS